MSVWIALWAVAGAFLAGATFGAIVVGCFAALGAWTDDDVTDLDDNAVSIAADDCEQRAIEMRRELAWRREIAALERQFEDS